MAALNKCNPAQLLILHIIKFLIYTLCFRGPTHNSLVLNSRGIKTTARWAPECCHLPGLTVPAVGAEGRRERRAGVLPWAKAAAQGTRGYQVQGRMSCSQRCCTVKCSLQPSRGPRARVHSFLALWHPGGGAGLQALQASLADIFLWKDFKRAVKNQKPHRVTNSGVSGWWRGPFSTSGGAQGQELIKRQSVCAKGCGRSGTSSVLRSHLSSSLIVEQLRLSTQVLVVVVVGLFFWGVGGGDEMQDRESCCFPSREWEGRVTQCNLVISPWPKGEGSCGLLRPGILGT